MALSNRHLYLAVLIGVSVQCGGAQQDPNLPPVAINEYMADNTVYPDPDGNYSGWLEIFNNSGSPINLSGYSISIDTTNHLTYELPDSVLSAGTFTTIFFSGDSTRTTKLHAPFKVSDSTRYILILHEGRVTDMLTFNFPPDKNESVGRNPLKSHEWIYYRTDQITTAAENTKPGLWKKIVNHTQFEGRDSSPNAVLVFKGKIWVLAGYRFTGSDWESRSDVWSSSDGQDWKLINKNPPYDPYSSFIVFKGKMWAFNTEGAYSSINGISWKNEAPNAFPGGYGARMTIFDNELWYYNERTIGKSADGIKWQVVLRTVPWQGNRLWPAFLAHKGKLYFFGGGENYLTGNDYYFNDVWSSADGVRWKQVTDKAPWPGRFWFSYASFDGKIWLMGGWNYFQDTNPEYGNLKDIWVTQDGKTWRQMLDSSQWQNRHAPLTWVKNNELYISSGYGGGGVPRMYNDIWVCTNKSDYAVEDIESIPELMALGDGIALNGKPGLSLRSSDQSVLGVHDNSINALDTGRVKLEIFIEGNEQYYPYFLEKHVRVARNVSATIEVYPNPLNAELKLSLPFKPRTGDYLDIYSASGQLQERKMLDTFRDHILNIPLSLPPGLYVYRLQNNQKIYNGRLVVK